MAVAASVSWPGSAGAVGWQTLTNQPQNGGSTAIVDTCHLLTDGTVMCLQTGSNAWHRLRPNSNGSYLNGTWDTASFSVQPMPQGTDLRTEFFNTTTMTGTTCNPCTYAPRFFASAVLASGKVVVIGGEFNSNQSTIGSKGKGTQVQTNIGFIYDPVTDSWGSQLTDVFGSGNVGDAGGAVLEDGRFVVANINGFDLEALNPATRTFSVLSSTGKLDGNDEEGLNILPDNTLLTVDASLPGIFELYDPLGNAWTHPGSVNNQANMPVNLADTGPNTGGSSEVGPAVLRADGKLIAFSGSAQGMNTIYDTATGTWSHTSAMDFPLDATINANAQFSSGDGPAAVLPDGTVIVLANPVYTTKCGSNGNPPPPPPCGPFNRPSRVYQMDFATNTLTQLPTQPTNGPNMNSYQGRMLVLPTGEVLFTSQDIAGGVQIYSNGGAPQDAWRPVITSSVPAHIAQSASYTISGKLFNGFSQGSAYGDDVGAATNYPLVRITNNASGHVFYTRTHDHSRMGVEAVTSTEVVTTHFDTPSTLENGPSTLVVVVNGIPSVGVAINVAPNHPPVAKCKNFPTSADAMCLASVVRANIDNGSSDPDGDPIDCQVSPPGPFGPGTDTVTLTCTDPSGASDSCTATVMVSDTTPPVLTIPADRTASTCTDSAVVSVGQATATDNCAKSLVPTGQVISKNGVALTPPITVVGGQVTLGIGTYVIRWTVSDGANPPVTRNETVVVGTKIEASQSFVLDDRAQVQNGTGGFGAVLNAGAGATQVSNDGRSGAILSVGPVRVLHRAVVTGNATSASTVFKESDGTITGSITQGATVVLPPLPTLPAFPTPTLGGFTVNSGTTQSRGPGSYTDGTVINGGTLILAAGDYFFQNLTINAGSTVRVTPTTRVFVQSSLIFNAPFLASTGTAVQPIFLGFAGTNLSLTARFNGTLVAPAASVLFGTGPGVVYTGSFFARSLEVTAASTLVCNLNTP